MQHRVSERNKMMLDGWKLGQLAFGNFSLFVESPGNTMWLICWHWQLLEEGFILYDVQGVEDIKALPLGTESLKGVPFHRPQWCRYDMLWLSPSVQEIFPMIFYLHSGKDLGCFFKQGTKTSKAWNPSHPALAPAASPRSRRHTSNPAHPAWRAKKIGRSHKCPSLHVIFLTITEFFPQMSTARSLARNRTCNGTVVATFQ